MRAACRATRHARDRERAVGIHGCECERQQVLALDRRTQHAHACVRYTGELDSPAHAALNSFQRPAGHETQQDSCLPSSSANTQNPIRHSRNCGPFPWASRHIRAISENRLFESVRIDANRCIATTGLPVSVLTSQASSTEFESVELDRARSFYTFNNALRGCSHESPELRSRADVSELVEDRRCRRSV